MAVAYTISGVNSVGSLRQVNGTFTTAAGDTGGTLANATHGLNFIVDYEINFDPAGLAMPPPLVTISSGTLTWTVDDARGYSGRWMVTGR